MQYTTEQLEAMEKAAPDMLEAGSNLINSVMERYKLDGIDDLTCPHMLSLARAIAKAKGESE